MVNHPDRSRNWLHGPAPYNLRAAVLTARRYFTDDLRAKICHQELLHTADQYACKQGWESPLDEYYDRLGYVIPPSGVTRLPLFEIVAAMLQERYPPFTALSRKYGWRRLFAAVVLSEAARGRHTNASYELFRLEGAIELGLEIKDDFELGSRRRKSLRTFGERRGRERSKEAERKYSVWREEAARVSRERPALKNNKKKLAEIIKSRLGASESVRTIRRAISAKK